MLWYLYWNTLCKKSIAVFAWANGIFWVMGLASPHNPSE